MALSVGRRVSRGRRLVRDTGAILQLVIAVVMLTQGIRTALRQRSATDDIEGVSVETDLVPVACLNDAERDGHASAKHTTTLRVEQAVRTRCLGVSKQAAQRK